MLHKFFASLLCILIFQTSVIAQDKKSDTIPGTKGKLDVAPETKKEKKLEKRLYSVGQFGRETVLFLKQPLRWKALDYI